MRKKKATRSSLPFVQIYRWVMNSEAWKDLSPQSRSMYLELKLLYNGTNNGRIGFGAREAATCIGMSTSSANRFLNELESHGFIARETASSFGQKRLTIEWRLTESRNDVTGDLATKDFMRWSNAEKTPVSNVKTAVSRVTLKAVSGTPVDVASPTRGTAMSGTRESQSHPRDTYTSKPYLGTSEDAVAPSNAIVSTAVMTAVRKLLSANGSVQTESITPVVHRLCDDMANDFNADPMGKLLSSNFPGGRISYRKEDLEAEVNDRLDALLNYRPD